MNNLAQILGTALLFSVCLIACVIPVAVFAVVAKSFGAEFWGVIVGLVVFGPVFALTIGVAHLVLARAMDWWDSRYD